MTVKLQKLPDKKNKPLDSLSRVVEFRVIPELIEAVMEIAEIRTYHEEGVLLNEGEPVSHIFLPIAGEIKLTVATGRNFDKVEVAQVRPGDFFGVWESYENLDSLVTVTCLKDTKILLLPSTEFKNLVAKQPGAEKLFRTLSSSFGVRRFVQWLLDRKVNRTDLDAILQIPRPAPANYKKGADLQMRTPHLLLIEAGKVGVQADDETRSIMGFLERGDFFGLSLASPGGMFYMPQIISDLSLSMIPAKALQEILSPAIFDELCCEPRIKVVSLDSESMANRLISGAKKADPRVLQKLGYDIAIKSLNSKDGLAELAMNPVSHIFRIFGIDASESLLQQGLDIHDRYSLSDYGELIESFGLICRFVRIEQSASELRGFPFLTFFMGRPILILGRQFGDLIFIDPYGGLLRLSQKSFATVWGGAGLEIHKSPVHDYTLDSKVESMNPQILGRKFVQAVNQGARTLFNQALAMNCFQTFVIAAIPTFFVSVLTDLLGSRSTHLLTTYFVGLVGLLIFQVFAQIMTAQTNRSLYEQFRVGSRPFFYKLALEAPPNLAQPTKPGSILSRFMSIDFLLNANKQKKMGIPVSVVSLLVYFSLMISFSLQSALLLLVFSAGALAVAYFVRNHVGLDELSTAKYRQEQFDGWSELLNGMDTIKSTNSEMLFRKKTEELGFALSDSGRVYQNSMGFIASLSRIFTDLAPIAAVFVCAQGVLTRTTRMEDLIGVSVYAAFCLRPISQLVNLILYSTTGPALQQSIGQMVKLEESKRISKIEARKKLRITGKVRLDRVSFRYRDLGQPSVADLSLSLEPGQVVAIVGRSGAGKTTLARMIAGLITPQAGKLLYDEVDQRLIHRESLIRQIGFVPQTPHLFGVSIAENISYGDDNPNREKIIECAKAAGAHDFIMRLPNGYDYCLTEEGHGLSVGEKQMVTLARALYNDPQMLVLDEATVHLDPKAETIVSNRLLVHLNYKTVVVVVQRISTARKADLILVVKSGRVIESGSHNHLMTLNGEYAELYRNQVGAE